MMIRSRWTFVAAGLLLLALLAAPVIFLIATVSPTRGLAAFSEPGAREALDISVLASAAATAIATVLGVPAGYWLARAPSALASALLAALAIPLALPPVASGILVLSLVRGTPLPDSLAGVVLAEFFVAGSFVALSSAAAFSAAHPRYEEVARTLGLSEWRIFSRVALPPALPLIGIGVVFTWLRALGEYGATSIVAYSPASLPVALYVALSARGLGAALDLTYGFVVLALLALAATWVLRRNV